MTLRELKALLALNQLTLTPPTVHVIGLAQEILLSQEFCWHALREINNEEQSFAE